jgi:glycosyltransferase involved in cell wall biosynthesis
MVVLEALAAGTPVVATAVRGIRELLTNEQDALLVPADDANGLAAAIARVVSNRELAARLAQAGRSLAAEHSEEAMVAAFLDVYGRRAA